MKLPEKRLKIINRKIIVSAMETAMETGTPDTWRSALIQQLRGAIDAGDLELRERFFNNRREKGPVNAAGRCYMIDQVLRIIYDFTTSKIYPVANPTSAEHLAVVATGGYGRGELAPYSDVDILFITPLKSTPWAENVAEYMLYILWDLHLKVGHATRTPVECVKLGLADLSIRTSLLESRFLSGDRALFDQAQKLYYKKVMAGNGPAFVEEKLAERTARHKRMGDSRYVVEPNIKEGKGGLRDLHTMWWIAKFLYPRTFRRDVVSEEILTERQLVTFRKAESFLMSVRVAMHYLSGRAEERINFGLQRELAGVLRYKDHPGASGVERFMKHYFLMAKQVGDLTRIFCAVLESREQTTPFFQRIRGRKKIQGFRLDVERLTFENENQPVSDPISMIKIFHVSAKKGYDIHPDALRLMQPNLRRINGAVRKSPEANALFLGILTDMDSNRLTLTRMNEARVLGRFLPDFARVVAQMQYDMYHHYTVDEHTIRALGLLADIESGRRQDEHPLSSGIIPAIASMRVLYVAVLLHDIAKGRGGDHSLIGADIARRVCPRLGLSSGETDTVAWLVKYHLLMSDTAFRRDLSDHKTIIDFTKKVQSPERLRLLLCLTVVDIRAVGPGTWNGWKGALLRDLYNSAEEVLNLGHASKGRAERLEAKKNALRSILSDWNPSEFDAFAKRMTDAYWIAEDEAVLEQNARMINGTDSADVGLGIATKIDDFEDQTTVSIYTQDHAGLFARTVAAFGIAGANIAGARIHTTRDGMAIDNYVLQALDGSAFDAEDKLKELETIIRQTMQGSERPKQRLSNRKILGQKQDAFKIKPSVLINNTASNRSTVIEIRAKDRTGILYDLAYALFHLKLNLISAHIATYGEKAVDVFYVRDLVGQKVENKVRLRNVEAKLLLAAEGKPIVAASKKAADIEKAKQKAVT